MLDEVRRLHDKNVEHHTRGNISELFGMETYDDNKQLEDQLSKGIVKKLKPTVMETSQTLEFQ